VLTLSLEDVLGVLAAVCASSNLEVRASMDPQMKVRQYRVSGNPNSPDITLISAHLSLSALWSTQVKLNSDHLPITIDFDGDTPLKRTARTYTNFRLADWGAFLRETEAGFADQPDPVSCASGERIFRDIVCSASGHWIPAGHRKSYTPGLPRAAVPLVNRRDVIRTVDPLDPEVATLNTEINDVICESSRKAWTDKVESCGPKSSSSKYWALIKNLSGKRARQPPNQPITFGNKIFY
jgi:hypothetical protein